MKLSAIEQLKDIYLNEHNIYITSFWDGGYAFKLGDPVNGYSFETDGHDIEEGIDLLWQASMDKVMHESDD